MKKILLALMVLATPLLVRAQNFAAQSFLNGWGVVISNNVTVLYGATNVTYIDLNTNQVNSLTNTLYPAFVGANQGYTNNQGGTGMPWWTNSFSTNSAITAVPAAWRDVPTYSDRNGNIPNDVSISFTGVSPASTGTNTLTLTFAKMAYSGVMVGQGNAPRVQSGGLTGTGLGALLSQETVTANQLVWPITMNGLTAVTAVTNLTSQFFGGNGAIRLISVASSNAGSGPTNCYINALSLNVFTP